jgi:hypothetical protein
MCTCGVCTGCGKGRTQEGDAVKGRLLLSGHLVASIHGRCDQKLKSLLAAVCLFARAANCRLFVLPEYKELNKNNKVASRIQYAAKF